MRKPRQSLTIDEKLKMIEMKESGAYRTWADIKEAFPKSVSESAIQDAWRQRETLRKRSREEPGTTRRLRRSTFSDVDLELRRWYNICTGLGAKSVPLTMAVLRQRAEEIAANLGVTGFSASAGFVRRWAKRHNLVNISLWGTGGSAAADVEASRQRMEEIRVQLEAFDPEQIYNMDETGLYFRCLPNRAYVSAGSRRRARGSKAMKNKDRVTLVLAVNATGSHKIPVAVIGKAAVPLCFKSPRAPCPLPYFSQQSAWMDGVVYEKWFNTVFVPAVRARTRLPCVLVVDNCGAHGKLEHPQVAICPLPPNVTSVHQPLDAGIIAALKRRYKGRLLSLVIGAFERSRLAQISAARASGTPLDSGGHGCPVTVAGSPGSTQMGGAAGGVATAGNEAISPSPGPTGSRHGSLASADSATPCRSRSSGGQAPSGGAAGASVGRAGCGDSPSTIGGDAAASEAGAAPRGWTGGSGTATSSAAAAAAHQEIGGADFGGPNPFTPSPGPGGSTSAPVERRTEGGGTGRVSHAFGGALGEADAWMEAGSATLAAEFLPRSARTTPRFSGRNTFRLGEAQVLPLGDMDESSPSISSGAGPVGPGSLSAGGAQGCVERGVQSGVSTEPPEGAPAGEPVNALASAPAAAPTTTSHEARISCETRVAGGLGGSSVGHVLATAPIYTPPTVTGLPADPAPPVPNVWTAAAETPTTLHPVSRRRSRPARRRAAPPRPVRGVRDGSQANLQDMSEIVQAEWEAMDPATISHCWVKARILPTEMEASVTAMHGSYRHSLRSVGEEVERVLTNMQGCSLGARCFGDAGGVERARVVETWLGLESDAEAILDTADAELWAVSSAGETEAEAEDEPEGDEEDE